MNFQIVILPTDALIYLILIVAVVSLFLAMRRGHLRDNFALILEKPLATIALVILSVYFFIGLLDSVHYRPELPTNVNGQPHYSVEVKSLLDAIMQPLAESHEITYSAPFATHLYNKELYPLPNGVMIYGYPPLDYGGRDLKSLNRSLSQDITLRTFEGIGAGLVLWMLLLIIVKIYGYFAKAEPIHKLSQTSSYVLATLGIIIILACIAASLAHEYHIFGTNKVGEDVFYQTIKSIRTGLVIGTVTSLIMLPFALLFGTLAGYFGGIVDDAIQYIYTTLSSVPGVLLIAASILSLQIFFSNHPELFTTLNSEADARLLALCIILGITSWTSLCRLLRGETLKLREMDYILAAKVLGVGHSRIIIRHIMPNLLHIIIITVVLDFSSLVLAEAVLSYVGVGVDPTTISWGNMINSARLEFAREPIVWWPLMAAFIFMFTLVLVANLFADAIRDAFDPRMQR